MNKIKFEKGITIISLIITIIVLLILAVVAIGAMQESKIIVHAQNARERYQIEKIEEKIKLEKAEMKLAEYGKEITVIDILKKYEGEEAKIEPVSIASNAKSVPANMLAGNYYILEPDKYASDNNEKIRRYAKLTSRGEEREDKILKDVYVINEQLDIYYIIEGAISEQGNGENDDSTEEIMWVYEKYQWGDEEPEYYLYFIGNVTELELTEDKEIKAYVGVDNDGEIEYDEKQIVTVKLSEVTEAYGKTYVEKLTVGEAAKNVSFNTKELVVLGDMTEIPEYYFNERGIENLVIQDGVGNIGEYAFARNNLKSLTLPASVTTIGNGAFGFDSTCKIYYGGTQEQWNAISSAFPNDIEVIIGQE